MAAMYTMSRCIIKIMYQEKPKHIIIWNGGVPDFLTHYVACGSLLGRDAAFLGPDDNQYAILEEDRTGLNLFSLKAVATKEALENNAAVLEENTFADNAASATSTERQGPLQFTFESEVDRIFSSPLGRLIGLFSTHPSNSCLPRFHQSKKRERMLGLLCLEIY